MIAAAPGACKSFGRKTDDSAESNAQVAQRIEKVAQNAAQQVAATGGTNSQETKEAQENRAVLQPLAAECETLPSSQVPPRGVEQRDQTSGKSETPVQGGTVCGTADAQNPPLDPQLQLLIEAWPTLSKAVQQQIMLLVG